MKLSVYLKENDLSGAQFGERIGASAEAVRLWLNGQRVPNGTLGNGRDSMTAIVDTTSGQVTANDFFEHKADAA